MKFFPSLLFFGAVTCLLGQTTPPPPPPPQPSAGPQVKLEIENPVSKPPDVPPDRVIITVGDMKITAGQFDMLVDAFLQPQYRAIARGAGRRQFADNIVQMLSLAQEAQREKLTETSDYKAKAMFQNANLMASVMVDKLGKNVEVSDADLRQYYTDHKSEYETVHAKHILIRFQGSTVPVRPGQKDLTDADALAKAQEIRKKLQGGADFAETAKAESDDVASGANSGGDMPAFKKGQMVPSFEEAAFAMKPGDLSEPVKSQYGYHIILVVSHDTKSFDEVKPDIEKKVKPEQTQKAVTKAIADIEKATPPVLDTEFFGPEKAPQKTPDKK